jgi:hypothetical protein
VEEKTAGRRARANLGPAERHHTEHTPSNKRAKRIPTKPAEPITQEMTTTEAPRSGSYSPRGQTHHPLLIEIAINSIRFPGEDFDHPTLNAPRAVSHTQITERDLRRREYERSRPVCAKPDPAGSPTLGARWIHTPIEAKQHSMNNKSSILRRPQRTQLHSASKSPRNSNVGRIPQEASRHDWNVPQVRRTGTWARIWRDLPWTAGANWTQPAPRQPYEACTELRFRR